MSGMPKINASMLSDNVGKLVCLVGQIKQVGVRKLYTSMINTSEHEEDPNILGVLGSAMSR